MTYSAAIPQKVKMSATAARTMFLPRTTTAAAHTVKAAST